MAVPRRLPTRFWLKVAGAFAGGLLVVWVVPRAANEGTTPPIGILLAVGLLVSIVTTGLLYVGLRFDLKLPVKAVAYAVAYNVIIVLVKFVLGPAALYEVNQERAWESLWPIDEPVGAALAAGLVLLLYAIGLRLTYVFVRRRWLVSVPARPDRVRRASAALVFGVGIGVLVLGLPLLFAADAGLRYLGFVFSSAYALLIGVALTGAVSLAAQAFRYAEDRQALVAATATAATLFWAGLAFLAMYHVLWVVYLLVLSSIWPLRVVVPK